MKVNPQEIGYSDSGIMNSRRFPGLVESEPDELTPLTTKR